MHAGKVEEKWLASSSQTIKIASAGMRKLGAHGKKR